MQIVLSNNRVVGYGENFLCMGGTVINTVTGAKYDNATIAECDCVPSDIGKVGYEYRGGSFVPSAPFGMADNTGYIMEVCTTCATPRNSGVSIKNAMWGTADICKIDLSGSVGSGDRFEFKFLNYTAASLKDYTEYRIVLKAGSRFELSEPIVASEYSGNLTAPGIKASRIFNSDLIGEIPQDCIAKAGILTGTYLYQQKDSETVVEDFKVNKYDEAWDTITIDIAGGRYNLDLTYELQVRG